MVKPGGQVDRSTVTEARRRELQAALRRALRGEISFDAGTSAVYATDSSNYRQVPLGVVFPLDHDDVVTAMRVCAEYDAPVLARGAGTSLAGQACNVAVVLDTSRHMTKILEIDPVARIARVQPGVVLDDLQRAAEEYGLTFGPDPATHAWCTLGGMIGNNSCGSHALYAGKTVDNVDRLTVVEYGGATFEVGAYDDAAYAAAVARGGRLAEVLEGLREIGHQHAERVRARFPDIPRRVSGYNLDQLLPEHGFHVARALVGTESTCAVVTEAVLRLSVSPRDRRLVVLGYPDIFAAADAVPSLLRHPLLALEGFDGTLIDQMRARPLHVEHLALLPGGRGWLLAELGADEPDAADALTDAFIADLPPEVTWRRYDDAERQSRVWLVRESGLGATAITSDGTRNHEGWEDAAVAPAKLGTYLRAITELWAEFGYSGAWYGHFGQGCVHTRNNFDFATAEGLAAYRRFIVRAADLVVSLGGSLSGEHGDGQSRGELLERMFGPELVDAFRQFKAVFDPRGRMNPGKLIDAYPFDTNLRYGPAYRLESLGRLQLVLGGDGRSLQQAAERCVGVGRCRRDDAGTMCPSYRATRDERHSTRGRAKLLVELFQGETTPATWRNEDVREALDLCLSCKGCAVDCPTGVDMASYKAEFLSHHYARRIRPRAMYALGLLPWSARAVSRVTWLPNAVLGAPGLGWALRRLAGITTARPVPRFARRTFRHGAVAAARRDDLQATVVVWPDTFTDAFRPRVARDDRRREPQLDPGGVRPQPQGGAGLADRHGVAAAVEGDERLGGRADRMAGVGEVRPDRERREQGPLGGEARPDRLALARPTAAFLGRCRPGQALVERVERVDLGDRHQVRSPRIAGEPFDEALLMAFARGAVVGPEAVRALEGEELGRRVERAPPERAEPGRVVVPDHRGCAAPGRERSDVAVEPGRPVLGRIRDDDVAGRVGQARTEQGDDGLDAGDPDARLAEVDLGLGARVMGERDRDPAQAGPAVGSDPRSDGRLATSEAMFGDETLSPDPPRGVVLLVVDRLVAFEPALDDVGDLVHDRGRPASRPAVRPGPGIVVRLWWKARASSRMRDPSRKWAYRIRSISTILINLSSRTATASITGTVLDGWRVKVVLR